MFMKKIVTIAFCISCYTATAGGSCVEFKGPVTFGPVLVEDASNAIIQQCDNLTICALRATNKQNWQALVVVSRRNLSIDLAIMAQPGADKSYQALIGILKSGHLQMYGRWRFINKKEIYLQPFFTLMASQKNLNFGWNNIRDEGTKHLSATLKNNTTLTALNLDDNNINDEGTKCLSGALMNSLALKKLILFDNKINHIGAKYLSEKLKTYSSLTILNLGFNNIGNEGVIYLSENLKTNSTLTILDLRLNKISNEGIKELSIALMNNANLSTLNLWGNNVNSEGAKYFSDVLKINSTLTSLNLECNNINNFDLLQEINNKLAYNKKLA
jgi:Ran GTPase-activating protein (RanGAP) involved in mRNA processing and transport